MGWTLLGFRPARAADGHTKPSGLSCAGQRKAVTRSSCAGELRIAVNLALNDVPTVAFLTRGLTQWPPGNALPVDSTRARTRDRIVDLGHSVVHGLDGVLANGVPLAAFCRRHIVIPSFPNVELRLRIREISRGVVIAVGMGRD